MILKTALLSVLATLAFSLPSHALEQGANQQASEMPEEVNALDELNPFDPEIEQTLRAYDEEYENETGISAFLEDSGLSAIPFFDSGCYRQSCAVWARVIRSSQSMELYVDGSLVGTYDVSTGTKGFTTPKFDRHPNGRIYDKYTSTKYPGGDYAGLGNMPYAVFIQGGFAIHGTGKGNWSKLGSPASHGCIRLHPDNAKYFNRLVRQNGIKQTWITVE